MDGLDADQLDPHLLTRAGSFSPAEASPRARIRWVGRGEPGGDRGSDQVPRLSLQHGASELLPLPEPGHIGGHRGRDASLLVRLCVQVNEQGVGERAGPEPGGEGDRAQPVLPGDELTDRLPQTLGQGVQVGLPRSAAVLVTRAGRRPPPDRWARRTNAVRACGRGVATGPHCRLRVVVAGWEATL